ncbi:cell division protein SepF [Mangrovactinospora gilvigrisea]|uniref:Cell division protein SepF n=1 Tax=Mangrovactinospora gilvigrisea TaxID=1428644 RepID=A0A1J7BHU7_9ACTN|nr:cell division protein SepF [Mangrovactinospora gilvigrisea]OIV38157.1 cell division protein SepF [Mangrovactinospora gilvigrisea]
MAGALRKMGVYLGLVEDDGYDGQGYDGDDEFDPETGPITGRHEREDRDERARESAADREPKPREPRPRVGARERDRGDRELIDDQPSRNLPTTTEPRMPAVERTPERPAPRVAPARVAPERTASVSSITPDRRSSEKNAPVVMPKIVSEREQYRITTLHPRTYNEARTIGEHFREGTPVIMNLTEMEDSDAKRLVDFAAGLIFGLHGSIERVTQKVFLLSPANVEVTAEDKARIAEGGFFNQS